MTDYTTPKPQEGTWTLIAPDGRQWKADAPIRCVAAESRERVPAKIALQRIFDACDEDHDWLPHRHGTEGRHARDPVVGWQVHQRLLPEQPAHRDAVGRLARREPCGATDRQADALATVSAALHRSFRMTDDDFAEISSWDWIVLLGIGGVLATWTWVYQLLTQ